MPHETFENVLQQNPAHLELNHKNHPRRCMFYDEAKGKWVVFELQNTPLPVWNILYWGGDPVKSLEVLLQGGSSAIISTGDESRLRKKLPVTVQSSGSTPISKKRFCSFLREQGFDSQLQTRHTLPNSNVVRSTIKFLPGAEGQETIQGEFSQVDSRGETVVHLSNTIPLQKFSSEQEVWVWLNTMWDSVLA